MKKIFTLLMAIVVTVSMSALPINVKTEKQQRLVKYQTEHAIKKQERMEKMRQTPPTIKTRQAVPADQTQKKAPAKTALKAAVMENIEFTELNYSSISIGPKYLEEYEAWHFILQCADQSKPEYGIIIQLEWNAPADDFTGTFTTENFTPDSWALTTNCYGFILLDSISMTISTPRSKHSDSIIIDAVLIGTDGLSDYAFKIHAEQVNIAPTSKVDLSIVNATLEEREDGFILAASNADIDLNLPIKASSITGTHTLDYINADASKFVYKGVSITPIDLKLIVSVTSTPELGYAYEAKLTIIDADYIQYDMTLVAPLPKPSDTIDIVCVNMQLTSNGTNVYFQARDASYEVYGEWEAEEIVAGTYTDVIVGIFDLEAEEYLSAWEATVVVSGSEKKGWVLDVEALCPNNKLYKMNIRYFVTIPTDTIVVAFDKTARARYYPEYDNDLQLCNEDEQYYASINVSYVDLGSSFTEEDMFADYSGVAIKVDGEYEPIEYAYAQKGLLSQVGDTTKMYAEFVTFDGKLYQVNLWHAVPTPIDTVTMNYESAEFYNNIEWTGTYSLLAYAPDSVTAMVITLYANSEEDVAGTYVNDGKFGSFGEGRYDINAANTYYGELVAGFGDENLAYAEKGALTVTMDEGKNITLTGYIIFEDAVQYNITMKSKYERSHLDYDAEDTPVDRTFTAQDSVIILDLIEDQDALYFSVQSPKQHDAFDFYLLVEEADENIILPVGEYEINDSYDYNTVLAGQGIDMMTGIVTPGKYAYMDAEGYLLVPMYFLVEGTVAISKNSDGSLRIEVKAVNSYDIPVHLVYDGTVTGIENIPVEDMMDTRKMMINGQLVIIRNGQTYNAIGAAIK